MSDSVLCAIRTSCTQRSDAEQRFKVKKKSWTGSIGRFFVRIHRMKLPQNSRSLYDCPPSTAFLCFLAVVLGSPFEDLGGFRCNGCQSLCCPGLTFITTSLFGTQGVRAPRQSKASNTGRMVSCKCAKPHEHLSKRFASQWFPVNSILISLRNALRPSSLVSFQLCKSMTRKCLLQGDSASADDNTCVGVRGGFPTLGKAILCEVGVISYFTVETMWHHPGCLQMHKPCSTSFQNPKDWHGRL